MSILVSALRGVLAIALIVLLDEIVIYLDFQIVHLWDSNESGYTLATIAPSLFSIQEREMNSVCYYLPFSWSRFLPSFSEVYPVIAAYLLVD